MIEKVAVMRHRGVAESAAKLLAQVEGELRDVDAADDQIGAHAEKAHGKLSAELERRRAAGPGTPVAQDEYLYLLRHQRQARQVARPDEARAAARARGRRR